jgi:plastocyanin
VRFQTAGRATTRSISKRSISKVSVLALLAGLLLLAGCGSSSSSSSSSTAAPASTAATASTPAAATAPAAASGSGQTLALSSNPEGQLKYSTTELTAKAGAVSIDFTNMAPLGHNVNVESSAGKVLGSTPTFQGGSKTLTLNLKAGTYKFFCSVPGHRMAGMEGTLTVK